MCPSGRLWQVPVSAARTGLLALALLGLILASAETGARLPFVQSRLPIPSVGSPARILDVQLANLDAVVRSQGGIDCIFVGNSLVLLGIDPVAFAAAYETRADRRPQCFNFAMPGITVAGITALARILIEDYRPRLLVYGVTARDFSPAAEAPAIEAVPWVQYRWGTMSIDGWLAEHSSAYRYLLVYGAPGDSAPGEPLRDFAARAPRGFFPIALDANAGALASDRAVELIAGELQRNLAPLQVSAIGRLLQLRTAGVQLLVLEMPVRLAASQWPSDATARYRHLMDEVRQLTERAGAVFWSAADVAVIPSDGWLDMWHMNARGAERFSRWLGERVAAATAAGELSRFEAGGRRAAQ